MKTNITLVAALAALLTPSAKAVLVIDNPADFSIAGSSNPSDSTIAAAIGITTSQLGTLQYKINSDGTEGGTLASSYTGGPSDGTHFTTVPIKIDYVSGLAAHPATYLLVKDGDLGSLIWNIGPTGLNWNGTDEIQIGNVFDSPTFNPGKDITGTSHIEFFGTGSRDPGTAVPEPSTYIAGALLLLPFGASIARRLRNTRSVQS